MDMEQGDALVQKKVQRVGKSPPLQFDMKQQQQQQELPSREATDEAIVTECEYEPETQEVHEPPERGDPSTKEPRPPPKEDNAALTDTARLLSAQLISNPKPLGIPPTNDALDDDDEPSWLRFSPKNKPPKSESLEPSLAQNGVRETSKNGHPISDEVLRQREEDIRKKELVTRRRRTTLAKFNNQKRNRLDLELRAGLPVSVENRTMYCLQSPAGATSADIRAMRDQKREEARRIRELREHQRKEFFRCNRMNLLKTMSIKMERRRELENSTIGINGNTQNRLPCRNQTLRSVMKHQQQSYLQRADQNETAASLSFLDNFDTSQRRHLKATKAPRKRDLPYNINAPFKRQPAATVLPQVTP